MNQPGARSAAATLYAAGSTASVEVRAAADGGILTLTFSSGQTAAYRLSEQRFSERLAGVPLTVYLRDGTTLAVPDSEFARAIAPHRQRATALIERFFLITFPILALVSAALLFGADRYFFRPNVAKIAGWLPAAWIENWEEDIFEEEGHRFPLADGEDQEGLRLRFAQLSRTASEAVDSEFSYQFILIDGEDWDANAFALPGGRIMMTDQLAEMLDDDQIIGVLGHEMGHVELRHSASSLIRQYAFGVMLTTMGVNWLLTDIPAVLANLSYSREEESDADCYGAKVLQQLGLPPDAMMEALEIIHDHYAKKYGSSDSSFMSSHPTFTNRWESLEGCETDSSDAS